MKLMFLELKKFVKDDKTFRIAVLVDTENFERYEVFINPFLEFDEKLVRGDIVLISFGMSNYRGRTFAQVTSIKKA